MDKALIRLNDKVRDIYQRQHVQIDHARQQVQVYWYNQNGKLWVPYGGGPLYGDQAKDEARWLHGHIIEFKQFLPKKIREYTVVLGELNTRTFPGIFTPV